MARSPSLPIVLKWAPAFAPRSPWLLPTRLEADWNRVRVEQALGDKKYGSQNTDGSCSIRDFYDIMRETGATARLMLERAAADQWKVSVTECKAHNHEVVHTPSGRNVDFGALASSAAKQPMPRKEEVQLKTPAEFRYIGKGVPSVDLKDICTGHGTYGFDARVPGHGLCLDRAAARSRWQIEELR